MSHKYSILFIFLLILSVFSCEEDQETIISVPENDRTEQQLTDKDSLIGYLSSHYYNSSEVNSLANPTMQDLVIIELLDGEELPLDYSFLIDDVGTRCEGSREKLGATQRRLAMWCSKCRYLE